MPSVNQAQDIGYLLGKLESMEASITSLDIALRKHMEEEAREQEKLTKWLRFMMVAILLSWLLPDAELFGIVMKLPEILL